MTGGACAQERLIAQAFLGLKMPNYEFNQFTGRLKNSTRLQPLFPLAPHPLQSADPPKMIWDTIKTEPAKSQMSTSAVRPGDGSTLPPHISAAMKKFQPPGWRSKPVFLMGGTPDKILFGTTLVLMAVGLIGVGNFIIENAPKK